MADETGETENLDKRVGKILTIKVLIMKKLSVSLFGVLAIVIAISSAFTAVKPVPNIRVLASDNDEVAVSGAPPAVTYSSATASSAINQTIISQSSFLTNVAGDNDFSAELTWVKDNVQPGGQSIQCDTDTDSACLVYVDDTNSQVKAFIAGDFSLL